MSEILKLGFFFFSAQTSSLSSQKLPHSKSKPEEQFVQEEEVISQIQAEKAKAEEAAAIVIPTGNFDLKKKERFSVTGGS